MSGYDVVRDVDVLFHDAQYLDEEYPDHVGWGHSAIGHVLEFARRSRVRRLVLFHHDPYHTDADLEALLDDARRTIDAPGDWVSLAYEGMSVEFDETGVRVTERASSLRRQVMGHDLRQQPVSRGESLVQEHRYSFDVDATPEEVWRVMHQRPTEPSSGPVEIGEFGPICRKIEHGPVTIEILHEGDENGPAWFAIASSVCRRTSSAVASPSRGSTSRRSFPTCPPSTTRSASRCGRVRRESTDSTPFPRDDARPLRGALPRLQSAHASPPSNGASPPVHLEGQRQTGSSGRRAGTGGEPAERQRLTASRSCRPYDCPRCRRSESEATPTKLSVATRTRRTWRACSASW